MLLYVRRCLVRGQHCRGQPRLSALARKSAQEHVDNRLTIDRAFLCRLSGWESSSAMQTSEQRSRSFHGRLGNCCLQPERRSLLREAMLSSWACCFRFDDAPVLRSSSPCSEPPYNLPPASDGSGPHGLTSARPVLPSSRVAGTRVLGLPC